jgi:hypothetical protein
MSETEYKNMVETGKVQESRSGATHVASPASPTAFDKQAKEGSIYVEFDVPTTSVKPGGKEGWAIIPGPNSLEGRNAAFRGRPVPEMPDATNIVHVASRVGPR